MSDEWEAKLERAKSMLDKGLISESQYTQIQQQALSVMGMGVSSSAPAQSETLTVRSLEGSSRGGLKKVLGTAAVLAIGLGGYFYNEKSKQNEARLVQAEALISELSSYGVSKERKSSYLQEEIDLLEVELEGLIAKRKRIERLMEDRGMVLIPAGSFQMGCTEGDSECHDREKPAHSVEISRPFYMSQTEVTQRLWKKVMRNNPSAFSGCGDDCPVEKLSWHDAIEFLNKLSTLDGFEQCYTAGSGSIRFSGLDCEGYRLPTEAEWEYAARGGEAYIYAGSSDVGSVAWYVENSWKETRPVCAKKENGYGLCDMSGNVYEWVWDRSGDYSSSKQVDPMGPKTGSDRVCRGGAFFYGAWNARVSDRYFFDPSRRSAILGFRLCRSSL